MYACRRLVHEVYRLVRQKAVGDVALRQLKRRIERRAAYLETVVRLKPLTHAEEHLHRLLRGRLRYLDGLKAPFKRRILFDVAPVLLRGRCADYLHLAPAECGL